MLTKYRKPCEVLGVTPLFAGLNHERFEKYCRLLNIRLVYKGELLVNEGDECTALTLVLEGRLSAQKYDSNGDFVTLNLFGPGDIFGEDLIFGSTRLYPYTVEALANAKVINIPFDMVKALLHENQNMLEGFLGFLSDRIREQNERISILSQRSLRQKISSYLIGLYRKEMQEDSSDPTPTDPANPPVVELPVTKEIAARLLAMPRPSFSRELVRMEKDGLIQVNGRKIILSDFEALELGLSDGSES